ncbi:MAG: electron transfer flavoprotein subunit beta/FixA family protein [Victivallaceae bacterium]|nr:electron transfer flavoprotein subunit beta/FixA family protein [Victivallaceae bacterium]
MKIIVCIKQVPGTAEVEIDPVTGVLKRDGVASKMNPYDLYAMETALQLQCALDAEIVALTMGPPQAAKIIREAYMMGADSGALVSDRRFGGADVLATSRTLAEAIRAICPSDLGVVICGKQTTDGDTAQVGAELAEFLKIPHVANVTKIHKADCHALELETDLPLHRAHLKIALPCLVTVDKGIFEPRLPSYKKMLATSDRPIRTITLDDFDDRDPLHYGLNGSPTKVKRIFPPEHKVVRESWQGSGTELAGKLLNYLDQNKFLQNAGETNA